MSEERKDQIKPIAIWTVILTGGILALLKVFGDGFLEGHAITVKYPYLEADMSEIKLSVEHLEIAHEDCSRKMDLLLLDTDNHHRKIDKIADRVDKCEDDIVDCKLKIKGK